MVNDTGLPLDGLEKDFVKIDSVCEAEEQSAPSGEK